MSHWHGHSASPGTLPERFGGWGVNFVMSSAAPQILIVEDEFLIRLTLSEVLTDEGYDILEAETGEDALEIMGQNPAIAVLLTDVQLPGKVDGHALARHARESRPDLPVIFMTGRPDAAAGRSTGAREMFVAKPYLPSEICAAVKLILGG